MPHLPPARVFELPPAPFCAAPAPHVAHDGDFLPSQELDERPRTGTSFPLGRPRRPAGRRGAASPAVSCRGRTALAARKTATAARGPASAAAPALCRRPPPEFRARTRARRRPVRVRRPGLRGLVVAAVQRQVDRSRGRSRSCGPEPALEHRSVGASRRARRRRPSPEISSGASALPVAVSPAFGRNGCSCGLAASSSELSGISSAFARDDI